MILSSKLLRQKRKHVEEGDKGTVAFCDGGLYTQNMEADNTTALIQGPDSDQKTGGYGAADKAQIYFVFSAFFRGKIFG